MLMTDMGKMRNRPVIIKHQGEGALDLHLSAFADLNEDDQKRLREALSGETKSLPARRDLISEGENPETVKVLLEGWAMRYKELPDGRRQIVSFFIPGDLCDANVFILNEMDHSVGTLTPIIYKEISAPDFTALLESSGRISPRADCWICSMPPRSSGGRKLLVRKNSMTSPARASSRCS